MNDPGLAGERMRLQAVAAGRMVDLTHPLRRGIPAWPGHPRFGLIPVESVATGGVCCHHGLEMSEHSGTHFDAPRHVDEFGGWSIDQAPLDRFFGRMVVIDATGTEAGASLDQTVLERWEALHGLVQPRDAVCFHFGWDRFWRDDPGRFLAGWPGLGPALCARLVARDVRIVATDCISVDASASAGFAAHHALLGAGILIGENFNNLGMLPPVCEAATLPLPIVGGTGSPIRAIGFLP